MKKFYLFVSLILLFNCNNIDSEFYEISKNELKDKIKGAWAAQTIGVTFGGPTEFRYLKRIIPDSIKIEWTDSTLVNMMKNAPGLYDDIYMDLTFVDVLQRSAEALLYRCRISDGSMRPISISVNANSNLPNDVSKITSPASLTPPSLPLNRRRPSCIRRKVIFTSSP